MNVFVSFPGLFIVIYVNIKQCQIVAIVLECPSEIQKPRHRFEVAAWDLEQASN